MITKTGLEIIQESSDYVKDIQFVNREVFIQKMRIRYVGLIVYFLLSLSSCSNVPSSSKFKGYETTVIHVCAPNMLCEDFPHIGNDALKVSNPDQGIIIEE